MKFTMTVCEMCGRTGSLFQTKIEGSILNACTSCAKYGDRVVRPKGFNVRKRSFSHPDDEFKVVPNIARLLQKEQQKRNMDLSQFSALINEKTSLVQKWLNGSIVPSIPVARKLSKLLDVRLLRKESSSITNESSEKVEKKPSDGMTFGDFIKVRTRK